MLLDNDVKLTKIEVHLKFCLHNLCALEVCGRIIHSKYHDETNFIC